jgi:hypothetical protein
MLTILDESSGNVLGIKISGKLTHAEYLQQLVPRLEKLIQDHGDVRVLVELSECRGTEIAALWDDLKFGLRHASAMECVAVVGEKKWQERMIKLSRPFLNVRYFGKSDLGQAWQWLRGERHVTPVTTKRTQHGPAILQGLTNCQHASN